VCYSRIGEECVIPASLSVIPAVLSVIPAVLSVIPALPRVLPWVRSSILNPGIKVKGGSGP